MKGKSVSAHTIILSLLFCFFFLLLTAGCGFARFPDEYTRNNPWDPDLSASVNFEYNFPFFDNRNFIQPRDIDLSFDGRYLAVISEPRNHLEIYDTANNMVPLNIAGLYQNDFQDIAFNGAGILYAIGGNGLTRINCTTRQAERREWDWESGVYMNSIFITMDPDPLQNSIYIYGLTDGFTRAFVAEYETFEDFPDNYTEYAAHTPSDYMMTDIAVSEGSLYFTTEEYTGFYSIHRWEMGAVDAFDSRLYYDSAMGGWLRDSTGFGTPGGNGFQPMDLDIANGYIYAFSRGDEVSAVCRTPLSLDPAQTLEWAVYNGTDFTQSAGTQAYNIAADPGNEDAVYVAANVRRADPPENRICRYLRTEPGIDEEIPGRQFENAELISSRKFIHKNGVSYVLDIERGAVLRSANNFGTVDVIGERELSPQESRAMTVADGIVYVGDDDTSLGRDVIKAFDAGGALTEVIDPFTTGPGIVDEILFLSDGRLLAWVYLMDDEILVYDDPGTGWTQTGTINLSNTGISNVRMREGGDGKIYAGYSYIVQGVNDSSPSNHSVIEYIDPADLNTVYLAFDTADPQFFSYESDSWSFNENRFGFVDLAVSPGGFAWLMVDHGIVLRLSPIDETGTNQFGYISCLVNENGPAYVSMQPLPYVDGIYDMRLIDAVTDTTLRGVSEWNSIAQEIGP